MNAYEMIIKLPQIAEVMDTIGQCLEFLEQHS